MKEKKGLYPDKSVYTQQIGPGFCFGALALMLRFFFEVLFAHSPTLTSPGLTAITLANLCGTNGSKPSSRVDSDRTRGNGFKQGKGRFRLDIRKKFFSEGGDALNRLPKEAVDAPSLQAFEARLDVALGSLGCWLATLHIAGGWNLMSPFQPGPFSDSMIL